MASTKTDDSSETAKVLRRAARGAPGSLEPLLERHRGRLRRMVDLRLARTLRPRVDPSEVLRLTFGRARRGFAAYLGEPSLPFFLWLRALTRETLDDIHRQHLGAPEGAPRHEVCLVAGAMPEASLEALAARLLGQIDAPSGAELRAENRVRLQDALDRLDPADREILSLRHFERLTNAEAAVELEIAEASASRRHVRALVRLREVLARLQREPSADSGEHRRGRG